MRSALGKTVVMLSSVGTCIILSTLSLAWKNKLHLRGKLHTPGHIVVYSAVGFVTLRCFRSARARSLTFLALSALAFLLEYAEHRLYLAPVEWRDIALDQASLALGAALSVLIPTRTHLQDPA